MAPGASSTNNTFREFYAPRAAEPPTQHRQQSMARAQHPKTQRSTGPYNFHGAANWTRPDDDDSKEAGCFGDIKNYTAGDEFVLLWKWVDKFMDKRRAKKSPSKPHIANKSSSQQPKPTPPSSREARRVTQPAVITSPEPVRSQAIGREDIREYPAQRHSPLGELLRSFTNWKNQQAKKAVNTGARSREEITRRQPTERRDELACGRPANRRETPRTNLPPRDQDPTAESQPGIGGKPNPAYNKKRGEVQKHTVQIAQLPPIHNSVHLEHTPSNNYRAKPSPSRRQKDKSTRVTRFSDFLHHERNEPPSQKPAPTGETQRTYAGPGEDAELARNSRFSSVLDPAKAIKKAKEAERAKGPKCYICGSTNCPGGYRDNVTHLWACAACQKEESGGHVECSVCGQPNSPDTGYAGNGLWMCTACQNPTTPKELPPSPKFSRKATSRPEASRPPIPKGVDKATGEHTEHYIAPNSASRPNGRIPQYYPPNEGAPLSEYDSDHLYSDDSYETRATTPTSQIPIGLGISFSDSEEEGGPRPTPPLKDSRYFQDSPTLPAMDYSQSYLRTPGTKHPYAPPTRTASPTFAPAHPSPRTPRNERPRQQKHFNPTTYPYPSPTALHKPRPASSVYPTDEPGIDFPYPPPPIPQQFANRQQRASSASPGMHSRARGEPLSPASVEGARTVLNRRSSWYDFWKPVFEKNGEKSP